MAKRIRADTASQGPDMNAQESALSSAQWLVAGRYDRFARQFSFPLPVFFGTTTEIIYGKDEAWGFFQTLHACLLIGVGARQLREKIQTQQVDETHFSVDTNWFSEAEGEIPRLVFRTGILCNGTEKDYAIERLEIEFPRMPVLARIMQGAAADMISARAWGPNRAAKNLKHCCAMAEEESKCGRREKDSV